MTMGIIPAKLFCFGFYWELTSYLVSMMLLKRKAKPQIKPVHLFEIFTRHGKNAYFAFHDICSSVPALTLIHNSVLVHKTAAQPCRLKKEEELHFSVKGWQIRKSCYPSPALVSIMWVSCQIIVLLYILSKTLSSVNCDYSVKMPVIHLGFVVKGSCWHILC